MSVKKRSRDSSSGGGGSGGGGSSSSGGAAVAPGCITSFYKRRNSSSGLGDMSPTDSRFVVATDSTSSVFPRHEGGSRLCPGRSRAGESGVRFGRRCRGSKDLERDCGNHDCLRRAGFSFRVGPEVLEGRGGLRADGAGRHELLRRRRVARGSFEAHGAPRRVQPHGRVERRKEAKSENTSLKYVFSSLNTYHNAYIHCVFPVWPVFHCVFSLG